VKAILVFLSMPILLYSALQAQEGPSLQKEDAMIVNSGEAQYDGKEIVLVGQVVVQHGLGQISARRLSVLPSMNKDKKTKFGFLKINEDVQIQLREGGELYCQQAEVDYAKLQGTFLGNETLPDVVYLNRGEEKEESQKARPPLEIKSSQMNLELIREPIPSSSSAKTQVKQIEANQNVRVHYNQDHLLLADHAVYQRIPDEKSSVAGLLTLTVRGNLPACTMTNLNGDRISAHEIQLNTIERKLWLEQPVGTLYMKRESRPVQVLEFSAQELIWNDQQQNLLLKGQVNVNQNQSLHVRTSQELSISQAIVEGKKTLRFLKSPNDTHISYSDVQKDLAHKIYCPGTFMIDHERQEMTMQGIADPTEQGSEGQQVYIEDVIGEMYADSVILYYQWQERQLVPSKMILEGHVRIMNRFDGHRGEAGSVLHYALADRVECFPKQQEMVLTSGNGNRVLFFDKVNNVQMSAPSLKVKHDPATQKEAIQGFGDVRFTFIEKEIEQLKSHFPFQKELKGAKSDRK
jgi:lipopolysaccharide export system protein LptA